MKKTPFTSVVNNSILFNTISITGSLIFDITSSLRVGLNSLRDSTVVSSSLKALIPDLAVEVEPDWEEQFLTITNEKKNTKVNKYIKKFEILFFVS